MNTIPSSEASESVVRIDDLNLDKECVRLPTDLLHYAHETADLKDAADQCKAELEVLEADLSKSIRAHPENYGIEKVTESAINAAVLTSPEYQKKQKRLREARHDLDLCQAVVSALECKKRSLVMLVDLHGMGYFADPRLSKTGQAAVQSMTKEAVRPRRRALGDND